MIAPLPDASATGARVLALDRISLNVRDLDAATLLYASHLGFEPDAPTELDPALARLLGARRVRTVRMRRGRQTLELTQTDPPGAPYLDAAEHAGRANDPWFQHCALVTDDMAGAYERVRTGPFTPISRDGPQALPGGIVAYKFRDPDGHPLELIAFPHGNPHTARGIDHTAIAVADPHASIAFYTGGLGLAVQARQINTGPAQDALDGLERVVVDVIALAPPEPAPHVELLGYRSPPRIPTAPPRQPRSSGHSHRVHRLERLSATTRRWRHSVAADARSGRARDPA